MSNLAHARTSRPQKSTSAEESAPKLRGIVDATLFEAVLAELGRARAALRADPETAEHALEIVEELICSVDGQLDNIACFAESAEEALGRAATAFALVDATNETIGDEEAARAREAFSCSIGSAIRKLRCIPVEISGISKTEMATS